MDKCVTFIVSPGRTGTTFLGQLLDGMIFDSFSVHEPDVVKGFKDINKTFENIKVFGIYHMIIGRLLGRTGIRNLAQKYQSGMLDFNELVEAVKRHREWYYKSIQKKLIIESFSQWYGILPAIPYSFNHYKIIGVLRDPRSWVASCINRGRLYGSNDMVVKLGYRRLNPEMVKDHIYSRRWKYMTSFQKLCWTWSQAYDYISNFLDIDSNSLIVSYENLFLHKNRDQHFHNMLEFITHFPKHKFNYSFSPELLNQRINAAGRKIFPDWTQWDNKHARQLHDICGRQMKQFGYGGEPEWLEKIS